MQLTKEPIGQLMSSPLYTTPSTPYYVPHSSKCIAACGIVSVQVKNRVAFQQLSRSAAIGS